jgi:hypothetical protein
MVRGGLLMVLLVGLMGIAGCAGQQLAPGISRVRGRVKTVSLDTGAVVVKPPQGTRVTVFVESETEIKGFASFDDVEKETPVELLFRQNGGRNHAVSLKRLPEGGC